SNEWAALEKERRSILQARVDAEREAAEAIADAQERALDKLRGLLEDEARIRERMTDLSRRHAAELMELDRRHLVEQQAVIKAREDALYGWMSVEERFAAGWANSAGALTRNIQDQIEAFSQWSSELDEARARGVSDDVIDLLG